MVKNKVLKQIIRKYNMKHGDLVNINNLKYISAKENIELNGLMKLLKITDENMYRIKKNAFNNTKIYIYNINELKEIELRIKSDILGLEKISLKRLNRISEKYSINIKIVDKLLNINKDQRYRLNNGKKFIKLKKEVEEKIVINEAFIEEVKYKTDISKKEIEELKLKYRLADCDICKLLNTKVENYNKLMQGKTKKMKIDLIDEYEKIEIEQQIMKKYENQYYTTKEEILELKEETKATDNIIKDMLSIPSSSYSKLMNGKILKTRIVFKDIKFKINSIKIELKYEYGDKSYTSAILRKKCRKYQIDFDDFLKNLCNNVNRYPYMKQALKNNTDGIYIGEDKKLSAEFLKKYDKRLENMCERITRFYCYYSHLNEEKSDIAQEAFILLLEKGGSIEQNFSYNQDLLFNLLGKKVKYFVMGKIHKRYNDILLDNFDNYAKNIDEHDIFNTNLEENFNPIDGRIKILHRNIMSIFISNKDYIYYNRENAYKIISYKLKVSIQGVEKTVEEIGKICLENGLAKECRDGRIIDMSNSICFN